MSAAAAPRACRRGNGGVAASVTMPSGPLLNTSKIPLYIRILLLFMSYIRWLSVIVNILMEYDILLGGCGDASLTHGL